MKKTNTNNEFNEEQIPLGVGETISGAYALNKLYNKGYVDGRTTLYHGTSKNAVEKIKEEGIKAKYTGKGSDKAGHITKPEVVGDEVYNKSLGKVFLTPNRAEAAQYAAQHAPGGGRELPFHGFMDRDYLERFIKSLTKNEGIVKARVPLRKFKVVRNPETRGSFKEFSKHVEKSFLPPSKLEQYLIYHQLNRAKVIEGDLPAEYIKGNKYKKVDLNEYLDFIKNQKGKTALGALGMLLSGGAIVDGVRRVKHGIESNKEK